MMKKLFFIFILPLITLSCLVREYMTEDVFMVGQGAEIRVALSYEEKYFEISVTVTNISNNKIALMAPEVLRPNQFITFVNSFDEKGLPVAEISDEIYILEHVSFDYRFSPDSLIILLPGKSETYTRTYEFYFDEFQKKIITSNNGEIHFNKDDEIYCLVRYNPISKDIKAMKELTDEYLMESFEKKYLLVNGF